MTSKEDITSNFGVTWKMAMLYVGDHGEDGGYRTMYFLPQHLPSGNYRL